MRHEIARTRCRQFSKISARGAHRGTPTVKDRRQSKDAANRVLADPASTSRANIEMNEPISKALTAQKQIKWTIKDSLKAIQVDKVSPKIQES